MKNLYDVLNENRCEALEKLKKFGNTLDNTLEFNYDEKNDIDERPYVLIEDRHGFINDFSISKVCLDETEVVYTAMEYYMLNKPSGVVSAREDGKYPTVLDLIDQKQRKDLFPVGRLDLDTEGLLLITNDGALCHELLSPKKHVKKVYYVEVDKEIPKGAAEQFQNGVDIGEEKLTLPAQLEVLTPKTARLTIQEGKFHQVKRMFEAIGTNVLYLKRLSMGTLVLDSSLPCGQYRPLTEMEIRILKGEYL